MFRLRFIRKKMENMDKVKVLSYSAGALLTLIGVSAAVAGIGFMWSPGGGMGLSAALLRNSPFSDYFIPGLCLFTVNGILSLIVAVMAFQKQRFSGVGTLILGALMIIWIVFQVHWIGWTSWLQPVMLAAGFLEMVLGGYLNELTPDNTGIFKGRHGSHAH